MKVFTDLEQSKKLAEILPYESADMCYIKHASSDNPTWRFDNIPPMILDNVSINEITEETLPCWSLAALLSVLKDKITFGGNSPEGWFCCYTIKNPAKLVTIYGDSLVDACVAMIIKLHELKML